MADMDVVGCLGCDLLSGRIDLPGGLIYETRSWVVNHVVGSMSLGTLVVSPREHIVAVADLSDDAAAELGPLLRRSTRVVEQIMRPEQTYVSLWAHGDHGRKHLHFVVQPVTTEIVAEYGGARSEQLQAALLASGVAPPRDEVEQFCDVARVAFRNGVEDLVGGS